MRAQPVRRIVKLMLSRNLTATLLQHGHSVAQINQRLASEPVYTQGHRINRIVGVGGAGAVFHLTNESSHTSLALKIGASSEEISIHSHLSRLGLGVPEVFYAEENAVVMELFSSNFAQAASTLHLHSAVFGREVLRIIQPIHNEGIGHFDISPNNLLVSQNNIGGHSFALADWGTGKWLDRVKNQRLSTFFGNPCISHRTQLGLPYEKIDDLFAIFNSMCLLDDDATNLLDTIATKVYQRLFRGLVHAEMAQVKIKLLNDYLSLLPNYLREFAGLLVHYTGSDADLYTRLRELLEAECEDRAEVVVGIKRKRCGSGSEADECTRKPKARRIAPGNRRKRKRGDDSSSLEPNGKKTKREVAFAPFCAALRERQLEFWNSCRRLVRTEPGPGVEYWFQTSERRVVYVPVAVSWVYELWKECFISSPYFNFPQRK